MTGSPVNIATLQELEETTGADFVRELIETFLADAPGMIEDLQKAVATNDADMFRRAAHSLKSNANIFGADALAQAARILELSTFSDQGPEITNWQQAIENEYLTAKLVLKKFYDA